MKVLVAIAVDDDEGIAVASGASDIERDEIRQEAIGRLGIDAGVDENSRLLWAEIEIPPPPPPIQAQAQEDE